MLRRRKARPLLRIWQASPSTCSAAASANHRFAWMEHYLFYMKALGLVEPEEERRHWCFHIMVSGHYAEWRETQTIVPIEHPDQEQQEVPATEVALGSGTN